MKELELNNVRYVYTDAEEENAADITAVQGVSFSLAKGSMTAILGHNGCGKSTLAKLVNALYRPTEGKVFVCGMDTAEESRRWEIRSRAGLVFQNPDNQLVSTVVEEDTAFGPENLGIPPEEIRTRVDEALAAVGMTAYRLSAPHMLSGGQKQRIAIAGVLAMRPEIMIFDESTAMLDPAGRAEVFENVKKLNREKGITVLWITHFMEEAAQCDDLLIMHEGKIKLHGKPREVFTQTELLREIGLDVPEMTLLAQELKKSGLAIREDLLTPEEMAEEIWQLQSTT